MNFPAPGIQIFPVDLQGRGPRAFPACSETEAPASVPEFAVEEGQTARPCILGRRRVEAPALIAVETVIGVRVHMNTMGGARTFQGFTNRLDLLHGNHTVLLPEVAFNTAGAAGGSRKG